MSGTFSSERPLNTDTQAIRTLGHVPLVSVLTVFHCIFYFILNGVMLVKVSTYSEPYLKRFSPGGGGVLPYISHIVMCGPKGYGFLRVSFSIKGSILVRHRDCVADILSQLS